MPSWTCPSCKTEFSIFKIPLGSEVCKACQIERRNQEVDRRKREAEFVVPSAVGSPAAGPRLLTRYRDAYTVARVTSGFGTLVKVFGVLLGAIPFVAGFIVSGQFQRQPAMQTTIAVTGVIFGLFIAFVLYILGVLVAAHGQILMATLDEAVHTSPFLSDEQKADVIQF